MMRKYLLAGVSLVALGAGSAAIAGDTLPPTGKTFCDPYKNYSCMDSYLGHDFFTRLINYYRLEWGKDSAPADPKAPPSRRAGWPSDAGEHAADAVHRMALWRHRPRSA